MADMSVLGSPAYLQTAGALGIDMQKQKLAEQENTQNQVDKATALPQDMARAAVGKQMNQIEITPQLADGLTKMTGQDWKGSVGTKWAPEVFTPMVTGMSQAKYHSDLMESKADLEKMRADYQQKKQDSEDAAKAKRQSDEDAAKAERDKNKPPKPPAAPKAVDPQTQGKALLKAIADAKTDDSAKKAAIGNYNDFAKKNGLTPYSEKTGGLQSAWNALKSLIPGGKGSTGNNSGDEKTTSYLQKHNAKDTPANREWAKKQPDFDSGE